MTPPGAAAQTSAACPPAPRQAGQGGGQAQCPQGAAKGFLVTIFITVNFYFLICFTFFTCLPTTLPSDKHQFSVSEFVSVWLLHFFLFSFFLHLTYSDIT